MEEQSTYQRPQVIRLDDGRTLAFAEYGVRHGRSVFYIHGAPSSRLDPAFPPLARTIRDSAVRLIAPDRPGYGQSDFKPLRSYSDWVADVSTLADSLGIEQFAVEGYSSGGPYAAACAARLPERVTGAAIVSGYAPPEMPQFRQGLGRTERTMIPLARRAPWLARLALMTSIPRLRRNPEKFLAELERDVGDCPSDRELLSDEELRRHVEATFLEATRQGVRAWVQDWTLHGNPFGFDIGEIRVPVTVWHGESDKLIHPDNARFVAAHIPNAELRLWQGDGHLHSPQRWREVLEWLSASVGPTGQAQAQSPANTPLP